MTTKFNQHPIIASVKECATDNYFYEHLLGLLAKSTDPLSEEDLPEDVGQWADGEIDRLLAAAECHSDEKFRIKLVSTLSPHKNRLIQMALNDLLPKKS